MKTLKKDIELNSKKAIVFSRYWYCLEEQRNLFANQKLEKAILKSDKNNFSNCFCMCEIHRLIHFLNRSLEAKFETMKHVDFLITEKILKNTGK